MTCNPYEKRLFCFDCGVEVTESHARPLTEAAKKAAPHNVRPMPLNQIPWNVRRDWMEEKYRIQEESPVFYDEE